MSYTPEDITPTAQGTDATESQTEQPVDGVQQADEGFKAGIQKRFDELTARYHGAEERAQKLIEQNLQLTQKMTDLLSRDSGAQQNHEPEFQVPEGMDPNIQKYMDHMLSKFQSQINGNITQLGASVHGSKAAQAGADLAGRMKLNDSGWVAERAAALAAGWRQAGLNQFVPQDAARFALAEFLEQQASQPQRQNNFGAPAYAAIGASNPQPVVRQQANRQQLPNNFNALSPEQQIALLEKRGAGDDFL